MYDVCPSDCPCWGSFSMCPPDCDAEMADKQDEKEWFQEELAKISDVEAELLDGE